jgi:hypothetical protein
MLASAERASHCDRQEERVMQALLIVWPILVDAIIVGLLLIYVFTVSVPRMRRAQGKPASWPAPRER